MGFERKGKERRERRFMLLSLLVPSVQCIRVFEHREVH